MEPKARVLIIEDDHSIAGSLDKELGIEGCNVAVAFRGDDEAGFSKTGSV